MKKDKDERFYEIIKNMDDRYDSKEYARDWAGIYLKDWKFIKETIYRMFDALHYSASYIKEQEFKRDEARNEVCSGCPELVYNKQAMDIIEVLLMTGPSKGIDIPFDRARDKAKAWLEKVKRRIHD